MTNAVVVDTCSNVVVGDNLPPQPRPRCGSYATVLFVTSRVCGNVSFGYKGSEVVYACVHPCMLNRRTLGRLFGSMETLGAHGCHLGALVFIWYDRTPFTCRHTPIRTTSTVGQHRLMHRRWKPFCDLGDTSIIWSHAILRSASLRS